MAFELAAPAVLASVMATSPATPAATPAPTLDEFEAVLRRHDSATLALEQWCAMRGFADPGSARVTARTIAATGNPSSPARDEDTPPEIRARLAPERGDKVAMRHVQLSCGGRVLSEAWNWYVPARLTRDMNEALWLSDVPFGKVVASLDFRRSPLATVAGPAQGCPPGTISTHQAMLVLPDGTPLAYLVECYTAANLAR